MLKTSFKTGLSFGLTSGIITTLGLIVGLHSGTHSKLTILGGVLTIAIADAFSDALGIHISEESESQNTQREIWESTLTTFFSKLLFALTFIVPIITLSLPTAIIISILWGFLAIGFLSFGIAREKRTKPWKVVLEHFAITAIVVISTHFIGDCISSLFG